MSVYRGLTAALLGQAAAGIELRHPYMTRTARAALQPLLGFPPISTRIHEVNHSEGLCPGMYRRCCLDELLNTSYTVQVWQAWHVVAPVKPQLYLRSQSAALLPPAEIDLFMKLQVCTAPIICASCRVLITVLFMPQRFDGI